MYNFFLSFLTFFGINLKHAFQQIHWLDRVTSDASLAPNTYSSTDGTDWQISRPTPSTSRKYSHNFERPSVCYEIDIPHYDKNFMWLHGPFHYGLPPGIETLKKKMFDMLMDNKKVVSKNGYKHHFFLYLLTFRIQKKLHILF